MAVTVNRFRTCQAGSFRLNLMNVSVGATGQSLTTPFHNIEGSPLADGSGTVAVEASIPTGGGGGPITFNFSGGGAANNVDLLICGKG